MEKVTYSLLQHNSLYDVKRLELLAPAKNCEQGIAAINHGADAVYIGAAQFGARVAAGNPMHEIEALVRHAHLYGAKVFTTVNTILYDNELEDVAKMVRELYDIGIDALITQDLGLLEMDLPPIELHASTQMHNLNPERVKFLEQVGFRRIILPRELSLEQMAELRACCTAELEAFVQGALCVSYSGQCYLSQYITGHSGNRGNCSQPCRSSYDLYNEQGQLLQHKRHLLSLKDFNAAAHLEEMIERGITSFKIEGRLKDLSYVKNVTAYYRQRLDSLMEGREQRRAASDGTCRFFFTPDLERTFNRGFTDYFLARRQPMATLSTQKSLGKPLGTVRNVTPNSVILNTKEQLTAGDGLCFFNTRGELEGLQVNHVQGNSFSANRALDVAPGTMLWRNNDFAFEKQLQGKTSERKIAVDLTLAETADGLQLTATDETGLHAEAGIVCNKEEARNAERAREQLQQQLRKLGDTVFVLRHLTLPDRTLFLPAAVINDLRRQTMAALTEKRIAAHRPADVVTTRNDVPYYEETLDYRANVVNQKSEAFYKRHGVKVIEHGVEQTKDYGDKALMTTKYCLRYELGQCLRLKNNQASAPEGQGYLQLHNNNRLLRLVFDCPRCEMQIKACDTTANKMFGYTAKEKDSL